MKGSDRQIEVKSHIPKSVAFYMKIIESFIQHPALPSPSLSISYTPIRKPGL